MNCRSFVLVFPSDALWVSKDSAPMSKAPDEGYELYALDGNIAFLRTDQDLEGLIGRLRNEYFGDGQFFLTDIRDASRGGNMLAAFWNRFSIDHPRDAAAQC